MTIPIIFEDDSMLIINKPPGMVVNRAQSVKEETIQDWIEKLYPNISNPPNPPIPSNPSPSPVDYSSPEQIQKEFLSRSGIVHRIDKETSGILLIAKNPEVFFALKEQFMNHTIQKTYLAIVHDKMPSSEGEINAPIDRLPWNKEQFGVVPSGKESITHYQVLSTYERKSKKGKETYQLVECYPKTGRTHQIRVHLKHLGYPLLGDPLYGIPYPGLMRPALHAHFLSFSHPRTQEEMAFTSPLPAELACLADL